MSLIQSAAENLPDMYSKTCQNTLESDIILLTRYRANAK